MKQDGSTRDKILVCARKLFFEKGYDTVGVQEIVDTAGITKPTMYYYFKSKQGLLECLMEDGVRKMLDELQEHASKEGEFLENLRSVTEWYLKIVAENQEMSLLLVSLFSSAKENEAFRTAKPYIVEFIDIIRAFFQRYADTNPSFRGKEDYLSVSYTGIVNMYVMVTFERGELSDQDKQKEFVENICRQFSGGCL